MLQSKNNIILFGGLAITFLINMPRLLVVLFEKEAAAEYGLTLTDIELRGIIVFLFSWLVLNYNLNWKDRWSTKSLFRDIIANLSILLISTFSLVGLKQYFSPGFLNTRGLFTFTFFAYFVILIILLLFVRVIRLNNQRQLAILEKEQAQREALYNQLEALRSQVNPHFLFNALNSLNALIRQKSDKASVFVDKLSWLLRYTLLSSEKDRISLQEELDYLNAYVFMQKERFREKLQICIDIPAKWRTALIPSFSLQLLVENAIKHNIISQKQPLQVNIFIEDSCLVVKNPIQKRRDLVISTGKGLNNLSKRFQLLQKTTIQIEKTDQHFLVKLPIQI